MPLYQCFALLLAFGPMCLLIGAAIYLILTWPKEQKVLGVPHLINTTKERLKTEKAFCLKGPICNQCIHRLRQSGIPTVANFKCNMGIFFVEGVYPGRTMGDALACVQKGN